MNSFLLAESGLVPGSQNPAAMGYLPLPTKHYVSPLTRCLQTCQMAFEGITTPKAPPFRPVIKEMVRERLGIHTCDRRSPKSWIEENFPVGEVFSFEDGFQEEDRLWVPNVRETIEQHAQRIQLFLEDVFDDEEDDEGSTSKKVRDQVVSVTGHMGSLMAMYELTGHPDVRVSPGALVPILIKAERLG